MFLRDQILGEGVSIPFLRRRCTAVLKRELGIRPVFIAQTNFDFSGHLDQRKVVDVVLFGDALLLLANRFLWPKLNYRLWVLSQSHRALVSSLFQIDPKKIGLIPRNSIISDARKFSPFPDLTRDSTAVISSRVAPGKNIELTLDLLAYAQKRLDSKLDVAIYSPLLEIEKFYPLLERYQWKYPPIIHGDAGPQWAIQHQHLQPFLINLSTSLFEDFNVSLAQWQRTGRPAALSRWAVFREVNSSSVRYLGTDLITAYNQSSSRSQKTQVLRQLLAELKEMKTIKSIKTATRPFRKPLTISSQELSRAQLKWTSAKQKKLFEMHLGSPPSKRLCSLLTRGSFA